MAFIITFIIVTLVSLIGLNFWQALLFGFGVILYLTIGQLIVIILIDLVVKLISPEIRNINSEKYATNVFANWRINSRHIATGIFVVNLLMLIIVPYLIKPILVIPALVGFILNILSDIRGAKLNRLARKDGGNNSLIGIILGKNW